MTDDPFAVLGLAPTAAENEIRARFRELALVHHPDRGGNADDMSRLVEAYRLAVARRQTTGGVGRGRTRRSARGGRVGAEHDVASFTVSVLPVEAYEALRTVVATVGEVVDENPPYVVEFLVRDDGLVWCRCELVPDAGSTTVSVSVAPAADEPLSRVEAMRDLLIDELNNLEW